MIGMFLKPFALQTHLIPLSVFLSLSLPPEGEYRGTLLKKQALLEAVSTIVLVIIMGHL